LFSLKVALGSPINGETAFFVFHLRSFPSSTAKEGGGYSRIACSELQKREIERSENGIECKVTN